MSRGGARAGAGRRRGSAKVAGGRAWARSIADDPEVRAMLHARAKEDPDVALKLFEHGYGRPPQALDVQTRDTTPGGIVQYVCVFSDGTPIGTPATEELPADAAE